MAAGIVGVTGLLALAATVEDATVLAVSNAHVVAALSHALLRAGGGCAASNWCRKCRRGAEADEEEEKQQEVRRHDGRETETERDSAEQKEMGSAIQNGTSLMITFLMI